MKRFFAFLLCLVMLLTMLPVSVFAAKTESKDVWEQITALEDQAAARRGADSLETRAAVYGSLVDQIIEIVESSEGFVPGSIIRHGDFFYWDESDGTACGYSPRLRAQMRENAVPGADPEACSGIETVSYGTKGGYPYSTTVSAFQPYIGLDSSFSDEYEVRCNAIAQALEGTGTTYKTNNATVDAIAQAIESSAVVIFDSHGDTDYASGNDYTSRANTSYICLQSGAGLTSADQATVTGPYGSYKHAYYAGSGYYGMQYYCVDGTAIANHMTGTSPNGLLWMAICLGMATDGLQAPLRAKGVEVVYGYSQSVTFAGDYAWEKKFWQKMTEGEYVKDAIAYMKQQVGCPDPYTSSYPAWPIVASSEDVYPGHGNVDKAQTVYSTWTLYTQFSITAVSNNTDWGTVRLQGTTITASPKSGYYVDGYEILEGSAAVERNGNVFNVTPESDCTIQINFAPRDPAVVSFSVPAGVSCEAINAYVGDEITLPTPSGEPAVESRDFRFLGWVTAPMEADSLDLPEFLAAGSKVKITEVDQTYYALYTYFVAVDGLTDDQFLRVDEAPRSWAGEYVISYNGQFALGASTDNLGSNNNNKLGVKKAVVDLAAAGLSYEGNILSGVTDELTYVMEPAGDGAYTVKMKAANHYLAMAADSDSLTTYTSSNSDKTRWTVSFGAKGPVLTNVMYPTRSLQYDADGNVFSCYTSAKQPLTLFAKADGDNWYTTDPKEKVECEEHDFGDWKVEKEPTCTENGAQYRICSVCGFKETETIDALGHDFGEWFVTSAPTCAAVGQERRDCSRCDAYETREIAMIAHTPGEAVRENVVPAACTEPGSYELAVYCSACGEELSRETVAVEALGHEFSEWTQTEAPTCVKPGVESRLCARCLETETRELDALGHAWDDGVVTQEPTATAVGVKTYTCTRCGETREEELPMLEHDCKISQFVDIIEAYPYGTVEHDAVEWAFTHEPYQVTKGMDETHFGPELTVTRAQAMVFLWSAAGKPEPSTANNPFSDVPDGQWYTKAVLWAVENKITKGMTETTFGPDLTCTRAQVLTFLYAAMGKPAVNIDNPYTDIPDDNWMTKPALWAYEKGMEKGADGKFQGNTECTRLSVVLYLYRFYTGKGLAE